MFDVSFDIRQKLHSNCRLTIVLSHAPPSVFFTTRPVANTRINLHNLRGNADVFLMLHNWDSRLTVLGPFDRVEDDGGESQ